MTIEQYKTMSIDEDDTIIQSSDIFLVANINLRVRMARDILNILRIKEETNKDPFLKDKISDIEISSYSEFSEKKKNLYRDAFFKNLKGMDNEYRKKALKNDPAKRDPIPLIKIDSKNDETMGHLTEFFTRHYKDEHNPLSLRIRSDKINGHDSYLDFNELLKENNKCNNTNQKKKYEGIIGKVPELQKENGKVYVDFKTMITSNGIGMIILDIHTKDKLPQQIHRELSRAFIDYDLCFLKSSHLENLFKETAYIWKIWNKWRCNPSKSKKDLKSLNETDDDFGYNTFNWVPDFIMKRWTTGMYDTPSEENKYKIPEFISIEELFARYEFELTLRILKSLKIMKKKNKKFDSNDFFTLPTPGLSPYSFPRFKSLKYETIIPFIFIGVDKNERNIDTNTWIKKHEALIAHYLIKPKIYEMGELSPMFIKNLLYRDKNVKKDRLWSISKHSFALANYHGIVRVKFMEKGDNGQYTSYLKKNNLESGFWMETKTSFLYTCLLSIQNYFTLRIIDEYLDRRKDVFFKRTSAYRHTVENEYHYKKAKKLQDDPNLLLDFVEKIILRVKEQIEEVDNVDKLIDSDPHIYLAQLINSAFGLDNWQKMILNKLMNLEDYSEDIVNKAQKKRENILNKLIFVLAGLEVGFGIIGILVNIYW